MIKEQTGGQQAVHNETEFNGVMPDRSYLPFSPNMISPEAQSIPLFSLNYDRPEPMSLTSPLIRPLDFANTPTLMHSFMNVLGGVNQNTMEEL